MNAFPGEGLDARLDVFKRRLPMVRAMVEGASDKPFAAGLWLDWESVSCLKKTGKASEFCRLVKSAGFYSFTANAFPFGKFHGGSIKTKVYKPDWSERDRLDYTCAVADVLKELLPEGVEGSISTLPGGYERHFDPKRTSLLKANLVEAGRHLREIHKDSGRRITLAVEMEPDCLWESPSEFCDFYDEHLRGDEASEFIGVCYDTCHQEFLSAKPGEGVELLMKREVRIAKFQLSAAICAPDAASKETLKTHFLDEVYLHQTREFASGVPATCWPDLPEALSSGDRSLPWKVHFHVPIFLDEIHGGVLPAKTELLAVMEIIKDNPALCSGIEIETYSYDVLPDCARKSSLEAAMARELDWLIKKLGNAD